MDEPILCSQCRTLVVPGSLQCENCGQKIRSMTASEDFIVFGLILAPVSLFSLYAGAIAFGTLISNVAGFTLVQLLFFGGMLTVLVLLGLVSPLLILSGIGRHTFRRRLHRKISKN